MTTQEIQDALVEAFERHACEAHPEWDAAKNSQDDFTRNLYCPRLDICVYPTNTNRHIAGNQDIDAALQRNQPLLAVLHSVSHRRQEPFDQILRSGNINPRCFLAVEIENSGSKKHMLGDIINAAFLGKFGIVVAVGQRQFRGFTRILEYLKFCVAVGKAQERFENVLLFEATELLTALNNVAPNYSPPPPAASFGLRVEADAAERLP